MRGESYDTNFAEFVIAWSDGIWHMLFDQSGEL
jgi:hypothetical protein